MARKKASRRSQGTGSVFYDKSSQRWVAQVLTGYNEDGKPTYRKAKRRTEKEAVEALNEILSDTTLGKTVAVGRKSLGDWLDEWLKNVIKVNKEPQTYEYYESFVRLHIKPTLGKRDVKKVDASTISSLLRVKKAAGASYHILRGIRNTLNNALTTAARFGLIPANPVPLTDAPKAQDKTPIFLTRIEASKLLNALEGDPVETLIRFGLATAMRLGEATGLTWSQVDLNKMEIRLEEQLQRVDSKMTLKTLKTASSRRTLYIYGDIESVLKQEKARQAVKSYDNPDNLVFLNSIGKPWDKGNVNDRLAKACEKAKIKTITYHKLRHSATTFMLMDGVPLHTVSKWIGHSNAGFTSRKYGHVLEDSFREAGRILQMAYIDQLPSNEAPEAAPRE